MTGRLPHLSDDGHRTEPLQKVSTNKNNTGMWSDPRSSYLIYLFADGLFHQSGENVNNWPLRQTSKIACMIAQRVKGDKKSAVLSLVLWHNWHFWINTELRKYAVFLTSRVGIEVVSSSLLYVWVFKKANKDLWDFSCFLHYGLTLSVC